MTEHTDPQSSGGESGPGGPDAATDSFVLGAGNTTEGQEEAVPNWPTTIWCILMYPLLRLQLAWAQIRNMWLNRQLRRQGIDPDSIPEIQELRRRFAREQEERKKKAAAKPTKQ